MYSRCYRKDEYSFHLASAAIHFIFTVISKYLNTQQKNHINHIKIYDNVCDANTLSYFVQFNITKFVNIF